MTKILLTIIDQPSLSIMTKFLLIIIDHPSLSIMTNYLLTNIKQLLLLKIEDGKNWKKYWKLIEYP